MCEKDQRMEKQDKSDIGSQISEADDRAGVWAAEEFQWAIAPLLQPSICCNFSFKTIVKALKLFLMLMAETQHSVKTHFPETYFFFLNNTHVHTHKTKVTCSI